MYINYDMGDKSHLWEDNSGKYITVKKAPCYHEEAYANI